MLISCLECQQVVSDQAIACPHCGYPIKAASAEDYYSFLYLNHVDRKPQPAEAFITFSQLYEKFKEELSKKNRSKSTWDAYSSAYGRCAPLYDRMFREIRKPDCQAIIDSCADYSVSTVSNVKKLFNQMYKIAIENDIVDRNYAENIILCGKKIKSGVPFTEEELGRLWSRKNDPIAQTALLMVYSGYRIGELAVITLRDGFFEGGIKTESGKNRVVPVHSAIEGFYPALQGFRENKYRDKFYDLMAELDMPYAASGDKHTPHDCRHTFSWLADKYKMDDTAKHMIMGHSLGKDVEKRVYSHRTREELKEEIEKIIRVHP